MVTPLSHRTANTHCTRDRTTIALTGATGFHGAALLTELLTRADVRVVALIRGGSRRLRLPPPHRVSDIDITDAVALRNALRAAAPKVVVHAASYTAGDRNLQELVNTEAAGTIAASAEAGGAGLVMIGTQAVVGPGPHSGPTEAEIATAPASPLSASRLAGERLVAAAGGTVLRPHLVHGDGDRWFIPGLLRTHRRLGAVVNDGRAQISVISSAELARLTAAVALDVPADALRGVALHASAPGPITIAEALDAAHVVLGSAPRTRRSMTWAHADVMASACGVTERHLAMIGQDNWYDSGRAWAAAGISPTTATFEEQLLDASAWYRTHATAR